MQMIWKKKRFDITVYISNLLNSIFGSSAENNAKGTDTFVVVVVVVQFDSCLTACRTQDCISIGAQSFFFSKWLWCSHQQELQQQQKLQWTTDRPTECMNGWTKEWTTHAHSHTLRERENTKWSQELKLRLPHAKFNQFKQQITFHRLLFVCWFIIRFCLLQKYKQYLHKSL